MTLKTEQADPSYERFDCPECGAGLMIHEDEHTWEGKWDTECCVCSKPFVVRIDSTTTYTPEKRS